MSKITEKIKVLLGIAKTKFGKVETDKTEIFFDGDELAVDMKVYDGNGDAIEDGDYTDGEKVYTVKDSVVVEIKPKEEVKEEVVKTTETSEPAEPTEKKEEELEDETIRDEVKEEVVKTTETSEPAEPTVDERVSALEELVEHLYEELMGLKAREVEAQTKTEEIIHEFSSMRRSPTAESITKDNKCEKVFGSDCNKTDKLKNLRKRQ